MRSFKVIVGVFLILASMFGVVACDFFNSNEDYLRIHIRANSNEVVDQNIKYVIKDRVVDYLTPYIVECKSVDDVKSMITKKEKNIEDLIDKILVENGFCYSSDVTLNNEFFPTRTYENFTLESNYYDAIIINLGEAKGDNWWCVVYPPLCFKDTKNVVYKSKIMEIIDKIFG